MVQRCGKKEFGSSLYLLKFRPPSLFFFNSYGSPTQKKMHFFLTESLLLLRSCKATQPGAKSCENKCTVYFTWLLDAECVLPTKPALTQSPVSKVGALFITYRFYSSLSCTGVIVYNLTLL
jgi:hypothetical protein